MANEKRNTYFDNSTATGDSKNKPVSDNPAWQAVLTGTSGALSATVEIYATQNNKSWTLVGTITLTVAAWSTSADDDIAELIPDKFGNWMNTKATISAISGTGAAVTLIGG